MNEVYNTIEEAKEATGAQDFLVVDSIDHENKRVTITPGELKRVNKQFVTVQHPRVIGCQHRLDLSRQPRHRNCETCWFAWFQNHGEVVQQLDEMHVAEGDDLIEQLQGKKFLHRWRQFMSTIASWKEVTEVTEKDEQTS